MNDAAPSRHPLDVARAERAAVAEAVAVLDGSGEHVGDRLDPAVRMPRKALEEIGWTIVAEVIEQQEWIELGRVAEAEATMELDARAFHGRGGLNDLPDGSD